MSAPPLKHLKVATVDGVAVVDFVNADIMYASSVVEELGTELQSLLTDRGATKILLDFRHVQYISSSMLAQLAKLEKEVGKIKGQLKLCGLGPVLMDTFRIGHFERIFATYTDQESALKAFH
jgi:anti-sigma B factor antagonist